MTLTIWLNFGTKILGKQLWFSIEDLNILMKLVSKKLIKCGVRNQELIKLYYGVKKIFFKMQVAQDRVKI